MNYPITMSLNLWRLLRVNSLSYIIVRYYAQGGNSSASQSSHSTTYVRIFAENFQNLIRKI